MVAVPCTRFGSLCAFEKSAGTRHAIRPLSVRALKTQQTKSPVLSARPGAVYNYTAYVVPADTVRRACTEEKFGMTNA